MKFRFAVILSLFTIISFNLLIGQNSSTPITRPVPVQTPTTVKVYPNPTINSFRVQTDKEFRKVEVYTVLGKKIKEFTQVSSSDIFQINDLSRGMYLISILDADNKVLKTVRLSKQ